MPEARQRSVQIAINGENRELDSAMSIAQLLVSLDLDARKIAVERNLEIVPRSAYGSTLVEGGDRLEIVHFIGGG